MPGLLLAHAKLVRSDPAANAALTAQPARISLWFSERPEPKFTVVQLLDSAGAAIVLGQPVLDAKAMEITVEVPPNLPGGKYTVSWRTAAADGHASSGRFAFTLTLPPRAASAPPPVISPADTQIVHRVRPRANSLVTTNETSAISSALRWAELVSLLTIIGAIVVRLVVLPRASWSSELATDASDRARSLAQAAAVLLLCTTLYRATIQAKMMTDAPSSFFGALGSLVRDTHWGQGWSIGAAGVVAIIVGLLAARRGTSGWTIAALGAVLVSLGQALTGHAASNSRVALAVATDVVHVLGAGAWLGGLVVVVLSALPVTRRLGAAESIKAGSSLVRSYHGAAIESVVLVLVSAVVAAWLRLPALSDLWTTPYGNMLLRKVFFVVVVLLFGLYHWRRIVSVDWADDTRARFRRSAIVELIAGAVVVAFTALLISTALPT
jgi:copper transport protein